MDLGLGGKGVLVTGGSKGIGLAAAQAFLAEGARVAIVSRSPGNVARALERLPGAHGIVADLSDAAEATRAIGEAEDRLSGIDVLVNSAGAAPRRPPEELDAAAYRHAMDAKYFPYVNAIDPAIKAMAARGAGVVVSVIGNGGKIASPVHVTGGAANAALMLVTAGLAAAYASRGIRVVAVNPGITETDRMAEGLAADARASGQPVEEMKKRALQRVPLGRLASPEEIASAVVFLASQKASYITGVSISMDGAAAPMVV